MASKELIYKDDARRAVLKANPSIAYCIDNIKAVDAVEVVRCKDCKGWCTEEIAKQYGVDRYCTLTMMPTNTDDFCSYGERREGE